VGLLVASVVWFAAGCPADRSDSPD
jgi:hypothetical protein